MRWEQLEYVAAVARFGSFRRAAEELHISQPALSEAVRKLELELRVDLLDRGRSGTSISEDGRELLPHILNAIESAESLRRAADHRHEFSRLVRIGTVSAATVPLMAPTVRAFRRSNPSTHIEVVATNQERIHRDLLEGGLDLGLLNYLGDEDPPSTFRSVEVLRGRPVLCVKGDNPLAHKEEISIDDLVAEPLIAMRSGYVMNRYLHRIVGERIQAAYSTDGAELGKLMVAEGLGSTILPDYSVIGDPLERTGNITYRPIEGDDTEVMLVIQRRASGSLTPAIRDIHDLFVDHGRLFAAASSR